MKRLWSLLIVVLLLTLFSVGALTADGETEIEIARQSAESYIIEVADVICPEWNDADVKDGYHLFDLSGSEIAYLFPIKLDKKALGYIVIGNSKYSYDSLEAVGGGEAPSIDKAEIGSIIGIEDSTTNDISYNIVYLGYRQFYAIVDYNNQKYAVDLRTKKLADIKELISSIASPSEYSENVAESSESIDIDQSLRYSNPLPVPLQDMTDGDIPPEWQNNNNCGPTSGAMISEYWKYYRYYSGLPDWVTDHNDLYVSMQCNSWYPGYIGVAPWNFGPGFVDYMADYGYSRMTSDWCLNRAYSAIQTQINAGKPMGVMFSYNQSYTNWHWCVVTGYFASSYLWLNDPWGELNIVNWNSVKLTSVITRIQSY